ncbi:MAG: hypothetical protein ACLU6Y_17495 [Ruminococcus sp.]
MDLQAAVITGVEYERVSRLAIDDVKPMQMGNLAENGRVFWCFAPKNGGSYSGTGDLFASVLSAGLVKENVYDDLCRAGSKFPFQSNRPKRYRKAQTGMTESASKNILENCVK